MGQAPLVRRATGLTLAAALASLALSAAAAPSSILRFLPEVTAVGAALAPSDTVPPFDRMEAFPSSRPVGAALAPFFCTVLRVLPSVMMESVSARMAPVLREDSSFLVVAVIVIVVFIQSRI